MTFARSNYYLENVINFKLVKFLNQPCIMPTRERDRRTLSRGGVDDTRLEAKAKNAKKIPRPRPRTDPLEAKDQGHRRKCSPKRKKSLQKFFSGVKGPQNFFLRQSPLEENKKTVFANFLQSFWRFPTKFQRFKK